MQSWHTKRENNPFYPGVPGRTAKTKVEEKTMIRVSVMYPDKKGSKFDDDYYLKTHIPLVQNRLGDALKRTEVYKPIGGPGGAPKTYVTVAALFFDSVADFERAFGAHADEILGDIPNFTDIEPVVQLENQAL
jgi:uncharacterized protein (TIGR02118 family)